MFRLHIVPPNLFGTRTLGRGLRPELLQFAHPLLVRGSPPGVFLNDFPPTNVHLHLRVPLAFAIFMVAVASGIVKHNAIFLIFRQ